MGIVKAKGTKGKCDALTSKIVRSIGYCENCGSTEWLQCSHIVSRRYSATRCDLRNVQSLCASCHRKFTDWPKEFSRWITKSIGIDLYEELKLLAETPTKVDWELEYVRLREIAKQKGIL